MDLRCFFFLSVNRLKYKNRKFLVFVVKFLKSFTNIKFQHMMENIKFWGLWCWARLGVDISNVRLVWLDRFGLVVGLWGWAGLGDDISSVSVRPLTTPSQTSPLEQTKHFEGIWNWEEQYCFLGKREDNYCFIKCLLLSQLDPNAATFTLTKKTLNLLPRCNY